MESKYVPVTSSLRKLDDSRHGLGGRRRRGAGDMGANPIVAIRVDLPHANVNPPKWIGRLRDSFG